MMSDMDALFEFAVASLLKSGCDYDPLFATGCVALDRACAHAADASDCIRPVLDESGGRRERVLHRYRQVDVAGGSIHRIAPALDDRILQGA
jgi:hypothetical protein